MLTKQKAKPAKYFPEGNFSESPIFHSSFFFFDSPKTALKRKLSKDDADLYEEVFERKPQFQENALVPYVPPRAMADDAPMAAGRPSQNEIDGWRQTKQGASAAEWKAFLANAGERAYVIRAYTYKTPTTTAQDRKDSRREAYSTGKAIASAMRRYLPSKRSYNRAGYRRYNPSRRSFNRRRRYY